VNYPFKLLSLKSLKFKRMFKLFVLCVCTCFSILVGTCVIVGT